MSSSLFSVGYWINAQCGCLEQWCLRAAPLDQLAVGTDNVWLHSVLQCHWLMPISCHLPHSKALLVMRLTHVSCRRLCSYRGTQLVWMTGHLMLPDRCFGTSCLLHCGHLTVSANSEDS